MRDKRLLQRYSWWPAILAAPREILRRQAGQSLVELAFIMPVFTLLLAGAADFARFAYASIEAIAAARAGVQYGAQSYLTAVDLSGMVNAALADGADVSSLQATASQFCVCSNGTVITCANAATTCVAPAHIIQYVQVNTTAQLIPIFPYPGLPSAFTVNGQATMRVQQ